MATAPFAALQQRVNSAVLARLANAQAIVGAQEPVPVIFDQPYAAPFDAQVDATEPECLGRSQDLASLARGGSIVVDGRTFQVLRVEPDGTGLTRVVLGV